ncbi:MAG: hypothetical protein MK441_05295 [SAR324 cluster bacterium]|nr:hypothetical protein [SAR324 cluster bacterium]
MEWLNQIPVNLDGGFISLGILLCSLAVITWVVFWIGKFEKEAPSASGSSTSEMNGEFKLMKEMTEMTFNDAIQNDPSIMNPIRENPVIPEANLRPSFAENPNHSIANSIIFEKKDSSEDEKEPLLNPIISSCSFRKLSPEMSSILKPLPPKSIQTKKQETEAEAVV